MCGIFGLLLADGFRLSARELMDVTNHLFRLSESRGKEASGGAGKVNRSIHVFKEPVSSSKLVKSEKYRNLFKNLIKNEAYADGRLKAPLVILGHSRLQTNGLNGINSNNQPVVKDGAV